MWWMVRLKIKWKSNHYDSIFDSSGLTISKLNLFLRCSWSIFVKYFLWAQINSSLKCCFNMVWKLWGHQESMWGQLLILPFSPLCFACQPVRVTFISDPTCSHYIAPPKTQGLVLCFPPPPPILHGAATIWKHILVNNISQYPNNQ